MARSSFWYKLAATAVAATAGGGAGVYAQTSTPTQSWTPAATCSSGLPTPSSLGGTYTDNFGALWNVECAQDNTGAVYDPAEGTNGQGMYACFRGCNSRPGCTAFSYIGSVSGTGHKKRSLGPDTDGYPRIQYWKRQMLLQDASW